MSHVPTFSAVPMIFAASTIYLIAASIYCDDFGDCTKERGYAVAVAVVSMVITGVLLLLQVFKKADIGGRALPILSLFLFLWWGIGAGVGTFKGPFTSVGNGYFAGWAAFLFATRYAYETNAAVKAALDKGAHAMGGGHHTTNTGNTGNNDNWNAGAANAPAGNAGSV